jgi:hypothetical protein
MAPLIEYVCARHSMIAARIIGNARAQLPRPDAGSALRGVKQACWLGFSIKAREIPGG